jgi:hypothetical protein
MDIKSTKLKTKETFVLPKGAIVENKSVNIEVEEIENGYLITKRIEIKYKPKDREYHDWKTICKKYYSLENPFDDIKVENKELADLFNIEDNA